MGRPSSEQLAQRAFDLGLLDDLQLQKAWASFGSRNVALEDFVQLLVRREFLTNYQIDRLTKGEKSGYFFGEYKVLYLVGTGTFARVYRAVHRETGQVVAVKVLRRRYSDKPLQYGQFVREGQLGCTLRHPNIVPIYEVVSRGATHFLVMEFVEGRNLREFVKIRGRLDAVEATRLMTDITDALQYAFEHGLTHRDLKMSNVLISSQGRAKLVDFGLAAMDEALTDDILNDVPSSRTIDYAGLERATGVRKDDTRSDIYFAGCIYYHMLTGTAPLLESKDRVQRLSKSRFVEVVPIQKATPDVPHSVALVVNKAMSLDVGRRYQTPGAMVVDLKIAAKRLAESLKEGGPVSEAETQKERDRMAAALATPKHSVMVVESNTRMQDVFRESFKKAGFRVLVTSDPERAVERFRQDCSTADCVLFNAQELGESALEAFNQLGKDEKTRFVPAVLLVEESQRPWLDQAQTSECRDVLAMPVTMKRLRAVLAKLMPSKE
jgi:serine/threonine protein kinase